MGRALLANGAGATGAHGVVTRNPVGANFQRAMTGPESLADDVHFVDNGMNLDSTDLPIPFIPAGP